MLLWWNFEKRQYKSNIKIEYFIIWSKYFKPKLGHYLLFCKLLDVEHFNTDNKKSIIIEIIIDIFMLKNCDAIVIFLIYDQFGAIQKQDPERIVWKLTLTLTVIFYFTKAENRTKTSRAQVSHNCLSKGTIFAIIFWCNSTNTDSRKIKSFKLHFSRLHM